MARVTAITLGNSRTGILSQTNDTKGEGMRLGVPTSYCQASTENLEETKYQQSLEHHPQFNSCAYMYWLCYNLFICTEREVV